GAFSNVYRAYDSLLEKEVAVKVVDKLHLSPSQRNFVHKEVAILRACNHPNIVKLHHFHEDKYHYMVSLELVNGGELFNKIIDHTYFSEPLCRHVISQVAEGIRYLHEEQGVVHRDIKPENILFEKIPIIEDPEPYLAKGYKVHEGREGEGYIVEGIGGAGIGRVKIADFGLSKKVMDKCTQTPCGTVGYTAPEIVKDELYSYSVDMWALGCVLYTLLCGFPPFYDEDINILTEKVAHGYFEFLTPWWDDISKSAKSLVSHLLVVNPKVRYDCNNLFTHPWMRQEKPPMAKRRAAHSLATPITPSVTLKAAFDVSFAVQILQDDDTNRRIGTLDKGTVSLEDTTNYEALNSLHESNQMKLFNRGILGEEEVEKGFALNLNKASILDKRQRKVDKAPRKQPISIVA
ncbi:Pkinase-domain-containing protein, partial [Neoconidiobolus thromboides FSU 785]